jgi:hypothetical protein
MFPIEDRERIRDQLIAKARADPLIVAAAVVGSTVTGGDRWSDLDLTFGVARGVPIETVLARWTREVVAEFDAVEQKPPSVGSPDGRRRNPSERAGAPAGSSREDMQFVGLAGVGIPGGINRPLRGEVLDAPHPQ